MQLKPQLIHICNVTFLERILQSLLSSRPPLSNHMPKLHFENCPANLTNSIPCYPAIKICCLCTGSWIFQVIRTLALSQPHHGHRTSRIGHAAKTTSAVGDSPICMKYIDVLNTFFIFKKDFRFAFYTIYPLHKLSFTSHCKHPSTQNFCCF